MLPLLSLLLHPSFTVRRLNARRKLWSGSFFSESGDSEPQCRLTLTRPAALARVDTFSGVFHSSITLYD